MWGGGAEVKNDRKHERLEFNIFVGGGGGGGGGGAEARYDRKNERFNEA